MSQVSRLVLAAVLLAGCPQPRDGLILTVSADSPVGFYDLYLRDDSDQQIIFHSGFVAVDRDISVAGQEVRIGLTLDGGAGHEITALLVGARDKPAGIVPDSDQQWFFATRLKIHGTTVVDARLLTVAQGMDADRDLWPDAVAWPASLPAAQLAYGSDSVLLDCVDAPSGTLPASLQPSDVNPLAHERCVDHFDRDCDHKLVDCQDLDGDGDSAETDCDDNDPARHHASATDPFPDPPNCCGYSLGKTGSDKAINYLYDAGDPGCKATSCVRDAMLCPSLRCGDGVDESCVLADTACFIDNDCDGVKAPADCDDNDPTVFPGAPETCADTKDKNCDGIVGTGCLPCDLDGDGYLRLDPTNNCNPATGKIDCNDYDAAIHPGSTLEITPITGGANLGSGKEGGTSLVTAVIAGLRGTCRRYYDSADLHAKIPDPAGKSPSVGDADCNGVAYEGCPSVACDADGDGYPNSGAGCAIAGITTDCDDANPAIFPNAPDKCGDGIISNCGAVDTVCPGAGVDKDGDGYFGSFDCDDLDANTHPFALELCDGKDNDCDGLVDEGNPDGAGAPLVTGSAIASCTTNGKGECAKAPGRCVCSIALTGASYDPTSRTFCPTETSAASGKIQPQCYGSTQPKPYQSCDATNPKDDDCDGSLDDLTGAKLREAGMPCGTSMGTCKPGTIVGCNHSANNCFVGLPGQPFTKAWFVCSSTAVCPRTELCNGLDDDCNGSVPFNEIDSDGDHFLACQPAAATLASGLVGGGDCNDNNPNIFPGAPERCNGMIDDCNLNANGSPNSHSDGVGPTGECFGTQTCCPNQMACFDLNVDPMHCKSCTTACSFLVANRCGPSGCMCGANPACTPTVDYGRRCDPTMGGTCVDCKTDMRCGPGCTPCTGGSHCSPDGTHCSNCGVDADCSSNAFCGADGNCVSKRLSAQTCTTSVNCTNLGYPNCVVSATGTKVCCRETACGACGVCSTGECIPLPMWSTDTSCTGTNACNGAGACKFGNGQNCSANTDCASGFCNGTFCQ